MLKIDKARCLSSCWLAYYGLVNFEFQKQKHYNFEFQYFTQNEKYQNT